MTEVVQVRVEDKKRQFRWLKKATNFIRRKINAGKVARVKKIELPEQFWIMPRQEWLAEPPKSRSFYTEPVSTVFIHTSVTKQLIPSATIEAEREQMRQVQQIAFNRGFSDFSYSYGVFPSGRVYEGRGAGVVQAATLGYNSTSVSICTIGNTDTNAPTEDQVNAIVDLINYLQKRGHLTARVDVRGHREVAAKACPGAKFPDSLIQTIQRRVNP